MKDKETLILDESMNNIIERLSNNVFGDDRVNRINTLKAFVDDMKKILEVESAIETIEFNHDRREELEFIMSNAVGTLYQLSLLCDFNFAKLIRDYIKRVENGEYVRGDLPNVEKPLCELSYSVENVQNGVIFKNKESNVVNVFEFDENVITSANRIRRIQDMMGQRIMRDMDFSLINEKKGTYEIEVVIKK